MWILSFDSCVISVSASPASNTRPPRPDIMTSQTSKLARRLLPTLILASIFAASPACISALPTGTPTAPGANPSPTVPYASDDPNDELWNANSDITPEAQRGKYGATVLGPHNVPLELQNPSLLAPPTTDHGDVCVFQALYNDLGLQGWWLTEALHVGQMRSGRFR